MPESRSSDSGPVEAFQELEASMRRESELLHELAEALARQREAVAHDRVADVLASVDDMSRLLHALDASRRRSGELRARLHAAGRSPGIEAAGKLLIAAAGAARREATLNHHVLRHSLASGERFLRDLFQSLDEPGRYGPGEPARDASARLVDRKG